MFLEKFPYRVKFYTKKINGRAANGHAFGVRVDGAAPRGFLRFVSLTAFQAEGCGGALRAQIIKRGAAGAAGCVEGL